MKQILFKNWNFMRAVRLILGIFIIIQSAVLKDWQMGLLGMIFSAMPLFNIGCCGTTGCSVPLRAKPLSTTKIYDK